MTDDIVDYDPMDYLQAVVWAKERAKELRRQKKRIVELEGNCDGLYADVKMYGVANGELKDKIAALEAELAALKAENERLQVCGNCAGSGHHGGAFGCFKDVDYLFVNTEPSDRCHYDPSLWKEGTP